MSGASKHFSRPDMWTAIFTGLLALTTMGALWYARDQIVQSHEEAKIQHLMAVVSEFDQEPMATYRKQLAIKRLRNEADPLEMYRELDFFETVDLLVKRGYLNEDDVWNQFRWWIFNLNADESVQKGLEFSRHQDANQYDGFISLVNDLRRIDEQKHGTDSHPTADQLKQFYKEESQIAPGGK